MLYAVNIWGKELTCEICSENEWFKRTLKTEFEDEENAWQYTEEVRYLFECKKCGNCKLFGMVSSEENIDDVNIALHLISDT